MRNFILLSYEGVVYEPNDLLINVDAAQVIAFLEGNSPEEAFNKFVQNNQDYLEESGFTNFHCYELATDYHQTKKIFELLDGNQCIVFD